MEASSIAARAQQYQANRERLGEVRNQLPFSKAPPPHPTHAVCGHIRLKF